MTPRGAPTRRGRRGQPPSEIVVAPEQQYFAACVPAGGADVEFRPRPDLLPVGWRKQLQSGQPGSSVIRKLLGCCRRRADGALPSSLDERTACDAPPGRPRLRPKRGGE